MRGAGRYVLAILRVLPRFRAADLRLTIDGQTHAFAAMMVAIANGPAYGGGMRVAPNARFDSGELEACVVGDLSKPAFLRAFPRVFRGTHVTHPAVTMLRGRQITLEADRPLHVIGDGERAGMLPVTLTVVPAALEIVTSSSVDGGHA
jgi:diacylglycerol kinase (ATP)